MINAENHKLAVAPMMDWTDRHCRVFHRLLAPKAMLYTEMITADAIIHGHMQHLLAGADDKTALQLGGSDPACLGKAVGLAQAFNYAEYNLNVGCPSGRVQSGRFGACLMAEPERVAECVAAMQEAAQAKPVSVKCRIGIDDMDIEEGLDRFIQRVADSGVKHFIVHARKALLGGLSPKENRTIPPLNYDRVRRLLRTFPALSISINGGITTITEAHDFARDFAGVMIGRTAYQQPFTLACMAASIHGHRVAERIDVARAMANYAQAEMAQGTRLIAITRHMLGLMNGLKGAKAWRRQLSESARKAEATATIITKAAESVEAVNTVDTTESVARQKQQEEQLVA